MRVLHFVNDALEETKFELYHDLVLGLAVRHALFWKNGRLFSATLLSFQKDDPAKGHVAFVTHASNLRALAHSIAPASELETRRVAGRIVPALITTTAFVSACSSIELCKILKKAPLRAHRNAFVNLALPFFAFVQPAPALERRGVGDEEQWNLWDRVVVHEPKGGMTLKSLFRFLKEKYRHTEIDIVTLSYGEYLIYANFLHDEEELGDLSVEHLLREALLAEDDFDDDDPLAADRKDRLIQTAEGEKTWKFSVGIEELDTEEEVELPPLNYVRWVN